MKLEKRLLKDHRDTKNFANILYQKTAYEIGQMIDEAYQNSFRYTMGLLSLYDKLNLIQLMAGGQLKHIETAVEREFERLGLGMTEKWQRAQKNFDILGRLSNSFLSRKITPPWEITLVDLQNPNDLSKDGYHDPGKGRFLLASSRLKDQFMNAIKQAAVNNETPSELAKRLKKQFSRAMKQQEASQFFKDEDLEFTSIADEVTLDVGAKVKIQTGFYTPDDLQKFATAAEEANQWSYRLYRPWFTDAVKSRNRYLRDLERILMDDTVKRVQAGKFSDQYSALGVEDFTWITHPTERTCEYCGVRHGLTMTEIKKTIKDEYGDEPPGLHPNCRCELVPTLPEDFGDTSKFDLDWDPSNGKVYKADDTEAEYGVTDMTFNEYLNKFLE